MLAFMIQHPHYRPEMLSSRQLIMCGAAPMPPGLLDTWMTTYPHLDFLQPNGMTEGAATGSRTAGGGPSPGRRSPSLGRPPLVWLFDRHSPPPNPEFRGPR